MLQGRRVSMAALLILPAALVLYFAFESGGFYPGPPAYAAFLLCIVLLARISFSQRPFAGLNPWVAIAAFSLGLYTLLTFLSGSWSHAPGVARVEFDLPLVYLLAMLIFGSLPRTRTRLRWIIRALAVAILVICAAGLISRLLPHVWPTSPTIANNRLSFPVTYWNALGLLAALGIVLCVHLSSDLREPRVSRILSAAAVPVLASTLLFTFSRGAIAVCVVALVVYLLIGRPRGLLSSLVALGPTTAIAIKVGYDANLLATLNPTTPSAIAQGHHVAVAVALCIAGAASLRAACVFLVDPRLRRIRLPTHLRRPASLAGWVTVGLAAVIAVAVLHGAITREYRGFLHPPATQSSTDLRARLTDPSNNGRLDEWRVAWHQFERTPVVGQGAGTYVDTWARYRPNSNFVQDAHSLYLETLDELGIVGLVLLLIPVILILVRAASRARGRDRALYAAVFAFLFGWALHAGIDWDWEMPVVSVGFFALGGFMLSRRVPAGDPEPTPGGLASGWLARAATGVAVALVAVLPAFTWLSQRDLDAAGNAFAQGDCTAARHDALSSLSILGSRAEAYEYVAYCDLQLGSPPTALAAAKKAVSLDPNNWNYRYDMALMRGASGLDPRAATLAVLRMNPHEPLVQQEWRAFRSGNPARWRAAADSIAQSFTTL